MSLRIKNVLSVVVIVALGAAVFFVAWTVVLFPPPGDYTVRAEFADSGGVTKNSQVKIGGVPGGSVEEIELSDRDTAILTMKFDDGAHPIGAGAVAASRPVNLLGEKYIDLDPGDLSKPQPSGTSIPLDRTSRPVELDDLLNTLQPGVRARMRILINEAGVGMEGRGADFNKLLENLPPALDETETLVADFSADNASLERVIVQSDRVITAFNRENESLQDLVDSAAGTLEITADKRRELGNTIRQAPSTLRQLQTTLADLGATATRLEPTSRQVRQAAPALTSALTTLPAFAEDARPALTAARAAAPSLTKLGREARGPVARLRPTLGNLSEFSGRFQPLLDTLDKEKGFAGLLDVMNGWTSNISRVDGLGHTFATQLVLDDTIIDNALSRYIDPPATKRAKPKAAPKAAPAPKADAPAPKRKLPEVKLPKLPKLPVPGAVKETLDGVGGVVDKALGDITGGLAGKQGSRAGQQGPTGKLLDYLLGP